MKHENGFALIYALIVMVVVGILVTGALFNALTSQTVAGNDRGATLAQVVSEAGLTRFVAIANQNVAFLQSYKEEGKSQFVESYNLFDKSRSIDKRGDAACGSGNPLSAGGLDLDFAKGENGKRAMDVLPDQGRYYPVTLPDGTEGGYIIRLKGDTITSEGYIGGAAKDCPGGACRVEDARAKATNAARFGANRTPGGIDSAIVANRFKGPLENVSIYGSVRALKRFEKDKVGLELSGSTQIFNDYYGRGADSDVSERVDELGAYKVAPDLCARISLSGDLKLDKNSVVLGTSKNKIKGVSLGRAEAYKVVNKNGQSVSTWAEVANAHLLENRTRVGDQAPAERGLADNFPEGADLTLTPQNCPRLFEQGVEGAVVSTTDIHLPPADPTSGFTCSSPFNPNVRIVWHPEAEGEPGYIEFVQPPTDELGRPSADMTVSTGGADVIVSDALKYAGKGTFWVGTSKSDTDAKVVINGGLAPRVSDNDAFLKKDVVSFVSSGDVTVGKKVTGDAEDEAEDGAEDAEPVKLDVAALLYAQDKVTIDGSTLLLGAVMADEVSLGPQGVSVAWDPRLVNLCPPGVPGCSARPAGEENGLSLTVEAYERR